MFGRGDGRFPVRLCGGCGTRRTAFRPTFGRHGQRIVVKDVVGYITEPFASLGVSADGTLPLAIAKRPASTRPRRARASRSRRGGRRHGGTRNGWRRTATRQCPARQCARQGQYGNEGGTPQNRLRSLDPSTGGHLRRSFFGRSHRDYRLRRAAVQSRDFWQSWLRSGRPITLDFALLAPPTVPRTRRLSSMVQLSRLLRAALASRPSGECVQSAFLGVVALGCFLMLPGEARGQSTGTASQGQKTLADELPRIPPVPADQTGKTFELQHGFRLELFAAEPQVASPVDACFDENGRMYVAEMRDYPFSWEPTKLNPAGGGKKDAGVVRLLEDTDGDGRADRSVIFADRLTWPTSVCCYRGGVFVLAPRTCITSRIPTETDGPTFTRLCSAASAATTSRPWPTT